MLHQLPAAGCTGNAREHARVGGGVNHPIRLGQVLQVAWVAEVAVPKKAPLAPQRLAVLLAPRPAQVVYSQNFHALHLALEFGRQGAADESAYSCDQNLHAKTVGVAAWTRWRQLRTNSSAICGKDRVT